MDLIDSFSIGVDIVSIARITNEIDDKNNRFINRVYTQNEIEYCKNKNKISEHFAGKFAGKEAVSKALKINWDEGINWKDIEIINEGKNGIPQVVLYGEAKKVATEGKIKNIQISISHEKEYAIAFAVAVGDVKK